MASADNGWRGCARFVPDDERYGRSDGSTACAGVRVADARCVEVPGCCVEWSTGAGARFPHRTLPKLRKRGQIPQDDGLIVAGGGEGVPVWAERHRAHRASVAGERALVLAGQEGLYEARLGQWAWIDVDSGDAESKASRGSWSRLRSA